MNTVHIFCTLWQVSTHRGQYPADIYNFQQSYWFVTYPLTLSSQAPR